MSKQIFTATLSRPDMPGTWTYLEAPFNAEAVFGSKSRIPVVGTIDGHPIRSSLMPQGNSRYILVVNLAIREAIGKQAGDDVAVSLEHDDSPRAVELPDDFAEALANSGAAREEFASLSYSRQKEYTDWIESAKKPETRLARIDKALSKLAAGEKLK